MKIYQGIPPHTVNVGEAGRLRPLAHRVKHSPTGFSWGYAGSGPADLARCILLDVYGTEADCRSCDNTGRMPDGWCYDCAGEGTRLRPATYQRFKSDVIARLPKDLWWKITEESIRVWLATVDEPLAAPLEVEP